MTKEEIVRFYETYYDNEKKVQEADNQLFEPVSSLEEWTKRLEKRSEIIRKAYAQNMEEIGKVLTPVIENCDLFADCVPHFVNAISGQHMYLRQDYMLSRPVLESMLKYFEKNNELMKMQWAYALLGNCYSTSLIEPNYRVEFDYQKKAAYNLVNYEMYDMQTRETVLNQNYNYYIIQCVLTSVTYEELLEMGEGLIEFLKKDIVKKDEKSFRVFSVERFIYLIQMSFVEAYYAKPLPKHETVLRIQKYAKKLLQTEEGAQDAMLNTYAKYWDYLSGDITGNAYFEDLYQIYFAGTENCVYFEEALFVDKIDKMPDSFYISADVVQAVHFTDYPKEKKEKLYYKIIQKFLKDVNLAKKGNIDTVISEYIQRFLYSLDAYYGSKEVLLDTIVDSSIRQQIQTYLHSLMVEKIASTIVRDVLEKAPELLIGFKNCQTVDDILSRKDEIIEYLHYAALLHDVGKIRISEIINLQYRKLTDVEFEELKKHPIYGARLINRFPQLMEYADVIEGHHKFYDGSKGYPEGFDNRKSPYKVMIDLITIADSTDAATDILGRNYVSGKKFDSVLAELKEGAGTRYSPALVDFIDSQQSLKEELSQLVSVRKSELYYEVYHNITD